MLVEAEVIARAKTDGTENEQRHGNRLRPTPAFVDNPQCDRDAQEDQGTNREPNHHERTLGRFGYSGGQWVDFDGGGSRLFATPADRMLRQTPDALSDSPDLALAKV